MCTTQQPLASRSVADGIATAVRCSRRETASRAVTHRHHTPADASPRALFVACAGFGVRPGGPVRRLRSLVPRSRQERTRTVAVSPGTRSGRASALRTRSGEKEIEQGGASAAPG